MSQNTVNMYERLLYREGIHFSKYLSILESVLPNKSCPPPYDELIKNDDRLMILEQNHVMFFKELKPNLKTKIENGGGSLSTYCRNEKVGQTYDGTSIYICNFIGMRLKDVYEKIRVINDFGYRYMKEDLPMKNGEYKLSGRVVSYKWIGEGLLEISVVIDGEITKYLFSEEVSGTKLEISGATQS